MPTLNTSPQSGSGGQSTDANIELQFGDATFISICSANGTGYVVNASAAGRVVLRGSGTANQFDFYGGYGATFPTSVGAGAAFSSGQLKLFGNGAKANALAGNFDIHVCAFNPANKATLVNTDWPTRGMVSFGSCPYSSWNSAGWNNIDINSAGLSYLNGFVTGIAPLFVRFGDDLGTAFTGVWASGNVSQVDWRSAEGVNPPVLSLVYALPTAGNDKNNPRYRGRRWSYYGRS